jgi:hypothetical protein
VTAVRTTAVNSGMVFRGLRGRNLRGECAPRPPRFPFAPSRRTISHTREFCAAHGGLAPVVRAAVGMPTPLSDVFAYGKTLSTLCSDIISFETRHDRTEAARAIREFSTLILNPDALAPINRQACAVYRLTCRLAPPLGPLPGPLPRTSPVETSLAQSEPLPL